jgi:hypothetical protein
MTKITRAQAKALELKYYFTGKPCKNGHVAKKSIGGVCIVCKKVRDSKRRLDPEYRARQNAQARKRRLDPEYLARERARKCAQARKRRLDPEYRARQNAQARKRRLDPEYRERRNARGRELHRKAYQMKRLDPEYRARRSVEARKQRAELYKLRAIVKTLEEGFK